MEPGSYHVYKSDAKWNVRGHKLTSDTLAGEVGQKLRQHIEGQNEDTGRVEIDGFHYVWFPAPKTTDTEA